MHNVFQVTHKDVVDVKTFVSGDVGKWCFIVEGVLMGFCDTREEAVRQLHTELANLTDQAQEDTMFPGCED